MSDTNGPNDRRWPVLNSIQALRGLAALGVVAFHQLQGIIPGAKFGEYGVDLFFVISGFIMTAIADTAPITPKRFALDRICRIVPTYWVATAATWGLYQAGIFEPKVAGPGGWHLLSSLFFIPHLNSTGHLWPTLFLGWTLNYEAFFYAIFAVVLLLPSRFRIATLSAVLLGLIGCGLIWPADGPLMTVYTNPRLAEFLAGAYLGDAFGLGLHRRPKSETLARSGACLLGMALLAILFRDLAFGVLAALVVAASLLLERSGKFPAPRFALVLGGASYSIYLFQQVAFDLSNYVFERVPLDGSALAKLHIDRWSATLAAVLLGVACHFLVERPLTAVARRLVRRLSSGPSRLADMVHPKPNSAPTT